jgi:hypothetical protein
MLLLATCLLVNPAHVPNVEAHFPIRYVDIQAKFPMPIFPGYPTVPMPGANGVVVRPHTRRPLAPPPR